jgi:hypothetical protein
VVAAGSFTDANGDALTYTAALANGDPLPTWLTFYASTQEFIGTPTVLNAGTITVRVRASDGAMDVYDDFTIEVLPAIDLPPLLIIPLVDQAGFVGFEFLYEVNPLSFDDPDDATLTYTATLANGDPLPAWLSFDAVTLTFSGVPIVAGEITVRVQAKGAVKFATDDFVIAVVAALDVGDLAMGLITVDGGTTYYETSIVLQWEYEIVGLPMGWTASLIGTSDDGSGRKRYTNQFVTGNAASAAGLLAGSPYPLPLATVITDPDYSIVVTNSPLQITDGTVVKTYPEAIPIMGNMVYLPSGAGINQRIFTLPGKKIYQFSDFI